MDTNVLLRYLLQDEPEQFKAASSLMESRSIEDPAYISLITLVEMVWTLRTRYAASPIELAATLERLLRAEHIILEGVDQARAALRDLQEGRASFPDALIAHLNAAAGCSTTVTFDRRAARLHGFTLLGSQL